ncbi:MAG: hypothetical protein R3E96_05325 [Planctomycetota bacterium]
MHLFTEAKKLAFEDRARFYADMDFADVPVDGLISKGIRGGAAQTHRSESPAEVHRPAETPRRRRHGLPCAPPTARATWCP